jgi:hypothetical protein
MGSAYVLCSVIKDIPVRIPTRYTPWSPRHQHLISRWKRYELDPITLASHRGGSGAVWEDRRSATEQSINSSSIMTSVLRLGGVVGCAESEPQPATGHGRGNRCLRGDGESFFFFFGSDRVDFGDRLPRQAIFLLSNHAQSTPRLPGCNGAKGHCRHGMQETRLNPRARVMGIEPFRVSLAESC